MPWLSPRMALVLLLPWVRIPFFNLGRCALFLTALQRSPTRSSGLSLPKTSLTLIWTRKPLSFPRGMTLSLTREKGGCAKMQPPALMPPSSVCLTSTIK